MNLLDYIWALFFPSPIAIEMYASASRGSCIMETVCIYGEPDRLGNVVITVHSAAVGWTGIGMGSDMMNSTMIVAWQNSTGGVTLSDRISTDHVMPSFSDDILSTIIQLQVEAPSWAITSFSFRYPIASKVAVITRDTKWIYALGYGAPKDADNPRTRFNGHYTMGSFGEIDFTGGEIVLPSTTSTNTVSPKPSSSVSGTGTCVNQEFCVYGENDGQENIIFTLHSAAQGWVGIGTGESMADSVMTIGWTNSTGGYTITDRHSVEEAMPMPSSKQSQLVPLRVPLPQWAQLGFSFRKPIKSKEFTFTKGTSFIYAYSDIIPEKIDSSSSSFSYHDGRGILGVLNFVDEGTGAVITPSPLPPSNSPPVEEPASPESSSATSTCPTSGYCVYGEPEGENILITIHSSGAWAGLGIGSSMSNSNMIIGWKNSKGGYTISDRFSSSQSLPLQSRKVSNLVELKHEAPSWASIAFTVSIKAKEGLITSSSQYIYAYSNNLPSNPDSPSSIFPIHTQKGGLGRLDFTSSNGIQPTKPLSSTGEVSNIKQPSSNDVGATCIPNLYCVYSEPDGNGNVYISILASSEGWVGLGTGDSMSESVMIIGWKNSTGGYTVSDRISKAEVMPLPISRISSIIPLRIPKPAWAKLAFSIVRPLQSDALTFTPVTKFIYAYSSSAPQYIDSTDSSFPVHNGRGSLGVIDFTIAHSGTADIVAQNSPEKGETPVNNGLIGSTCITGQYCVYSEPDGLGNVFITLHGAMEGWVGLGTGDSMVGSAMIVGWKNGDDYVVSDRISSGESMPRPSTSMQSQLVPLKVSAPAWAKLAFTILRPLKSNDVAFTPTSTYIYALCKKGPSDPTSVSSAFPIHDTFGKLGNLDLTTFHNGVGSSSGGGVSSILQLPDWTDYTTVIRIHGYAMIYSWLLCPILGIFIARYLKDRLGHWWFRLHVFFMLFGCVLGSFGAALLIFMYKAGPHFAYSTSAHPLMGLLVIIIMIIQIILGFASDRLFSLERDSVPWWDKAHWWTGRLVSILAIISIATGIVYSDYFSASALAMPVLAGIIGFGGICAFAFGETKFGQINHITKSGSDSEEALTSRK